MKSTCIIGSPKNNGNTAFLVDKIIDGMKDSGVEVERYVLGEQNISYCRGCRECITSRECVQRDDMDKLIDSIFNADVVLLASPSYWGEVTGQTKVFIDRCTPLCNAETGKTPVPPGKVGISVAIRAGDSEIETSHIVDTIKHYFSHLEIRPILEMTVEGVLVREDFKSKADKISEAYEIGKSITKKFSQIG